MSQCFCLYLTYASCVFGTVCASWAMNSNRLKHTNVFSLVIIVPFKQVMPRIVIPDLHNLGYHSNRWDIGSWTWWWWVYAGVFVLAHFSSSDWIRLRWGDAVFVEVLMTVVSKVCLMMFRRSVSGCRSELCLLCEQNWAHKASLTHPQTPT